MARAIARGDGPAKEPSGFSQAGAISRGSMGEPLQIEPPSVGRPHAPGNGASIARSVAGQSVVLLHLAPLLRRGVRERRAGGRVADDLAIPKINPIANILPREMDGLAKRNIPKGFRVIAEFRGKAGAICA